MVGVTPAVSTTTGLCSINSAPPQSNSRTPAVPMRSCPARRRRPTATAGSSHGELAGGKREGRESACSAAGQRSRGGREDSRGLGTGQRWTCSHPPPLPGNGRGGGEERGAGAECRAGPGRGGGGWAQLTTRPPEDKTHTLG